MHEIRGKRISMIFQEPMTSLDPCYTIGNQLEEALLEHQKIPTGQARERAVYLLEKVGITAAASRLKQYPHQLSGGLRQRVMIAMGLMCSPGLIIADEPTSSLDAERREAFIELLFRECESAGSTLVFVSHDNSLLAPFDRTIEFAEVNQTELVSQATLHVAG